MAKIQSNSEVVVDYLKQHGVITDIDATDKLGVRRLSDVIFKLRNKGFGIKTIYAKGVNRRGKQTKYGQYFLTTIPSSWNP